MTRTIDQLDDQVRTTTLELLDHAQAAGWRLVKARVARSCRSAYLTLKRHDDIAICVRVSDHPSSRFQTTFKPPSRTSKHYAAFSLRAGRAGTLTHLLCWLRSHAPTAPPVGP